MRCPDAISAIILEMLETGLVQIRLHGWEGRSDVCALHADHLHNLPALPADYTPAKLGYYWDAERPAFASRVPPEPLGRWQTFWEQLRPLAESLGHAASSH